MTKSWSDIKRFESSDANVLKYVFTQEDAVAEAVLYGYPTHQDRTVICCSTQSGCPVGCTFCGTGENFIRSLSASEIIAQVEHLIIDQNINTASVKSFQIMFMSMGEPLLNYRALAEACRTLTVTYPRARLLISTSGPDVGDVYEKLRVLSIEVPAIGLQFSVHESLDHKRNELIPFKAKLSLMDMAEQGELWSGATGRQPFFNYCVHEENNSDDDADRLMATFVPGIWQATISVICEKDESIAQANTRQRELADAFQEKLAVRGYSTRVFDPAGQDDIGGGCGQLWYVQNWMKDHPEMVRKTY